MGNWQSDAAYNAFSGVLDPCTCGTWAELETHTSGVKRIACEDCGIVLMATTKPKVMVMWNRVQRHKSTNSLTRSRNRNSKVTGERNKPTHV